MGKPSVGIDPIKTQTSSRRKPESHQHFVEGSGSSTSPDTSSASVVSPPPSSSQSSSDRVFSSSFSNQYLRAPSESSSTARVSEPMSSAMGNSKQQPTTTTRSHVDNTGSRSATASYAASRTSSTHGFLRGGSRKVSTSAVDRQMLEEYERINTEIERVVRMTHSDMNGDENAELVKQVRRDLRKVRRSSSQMIQSQKDLLEKMERQEKSGFRRFFSMNKEQKMEKLRGKLCEKLSEAVVVDEELQRLERQSMALTRTSFGSTAYGTFLEIDELAQLERDRDDILSNLVNASGLTDAQELHSRLTLFSSEKRACESVLKQVEQCEVHYRKALYLLRIALSTIVAPTYTGLLKEFVLGPYPLAVEAGQLVEGASRMIQPESRRRYSAYAPELSNVRPPKFPQPMIEFAKRGARSNFDPSNSAAVEAIRKLRTSENVVILMQRIVIQKLELIEKWRNHVEKDLERADAGYKKFDAKLQEHLALLAGRAAAA